MPGRVPYDSRKLAELVVYIADKSVNDTRFGKTKLNKLLFFADFTAYRMHGRSITGAAYQHLPQGPAPHQMLPVLRELTQEGAIAIRGEDTYAGTQQRVIALRDAILTEFTGDEIAVVDRVLDQLAPLTNAEVSELSHHTWAWRLTDEYQEIPYGAAMISSEDPTDDDLLWLKEVASSGTVGSP